MKDIAMLIGGASVGLSGCRDRQSLVNPATEEPFAEIPLATMEDIDLAVAAARDAFPIWSRLSPSVRGNYLRKASDLLASRSEEIGRTMTLEMGKPISEAIGEVQKAALALRYYAEEGERVYGRIVANENSEFESSILYQPLGPVAAITPWNYPVELLCWKTAAALAAGCTMVAKPASITPLSSLLFLLCIADAGVPPGTVNIIFGSGSKVGDRLIGNPVLKKVAFTGSTEVGKRIVSMCGGMMKKVSAELGGQCPLIVSNHARLEAAVTDGVRRSFRNNGQICIAINRIFVQKEVYEPFIRRFAEESAALKIGDSLLEMDCQLGPMATKSGRDKVIEHHDDALAKGARLLCGGKIPAGRDTGFFFEPTVLADTKPGMKVMSEESFGPIVGIMPYTTNEEALSLANATNYGLASYVYTDDFFEVEYFARNLESGNVAINNPDAGVMNAPYGGWKDSGDGYEHGPEGLFSYLKIKHVRKRISSPS
jgi:succinate-semialdehyde dehydrogenase/glutarate-semialdehyde dehydrogenase